MAGVLGGTIIGGEDQRLQGWNRGEKDHRLQGWKRGIDAECPPDTRWMSSEPLLRALSSFLGMCKTTWNHGGMHEITRNHMPPFFPSFLSLRSPKLFPALIPSLYPISLPPRGHLAHSPIFSFRSLVPPPRPISSTPHAHLSHVLFSFHFPLLPHRVRFTNRCYLTCPNPNPCLMPHFLFLPLTCHHCHWSILFSLFNHLTVPFLFRSILPVVVWLIPDQSKSLFSLLCFWHYLCLLLALWASLPMLVEHLHPHQTPPTWSMHSLACSVIPPRTTWFRVYQTVGY